MTRFEQFIKERRYLGNVSERSIEWYQQAFKWLPNDNPTEAELKQALLSLARHEHSRECLLLLEAILETPGLMPRLAEVLRPKSHDTKNNGTGKKSQGSGKKVGK